MTGSVAVHDGVAFVPAASWEETRSIDPAYPCCTFRGSVTALRVRDGSVVWKTYLVDLPQKTGMTAAGTATFGPVGCRRLVDADRGCCARRALRDDRRQLLASRDRDERRRRGAGSRSPAASSGRGRRRRATSTTHRAAPRRELPRGRGPDHDFGSSAMLVRDTDGRDVLVAGQKSGVVYALDPANKARCSGRLASGRAARTAACSGAWRATAVTSMRPSPTSSGCRA